jgi:hypothetical protein
MHSWLEPISGFHGLGLFAVCGLSPQPFWPKVQFRLMLNQSTPFDMEEFDPSLAQFGRCHGEAVDFFDTVNFTVAILDQGTIQADAQPTHAF